MKKILLSLLLVVVGISSASAQFEKGKYYLGATANAGSLSYSKHEKFGINLGVNGGYLFEDGWMLLTEVGFDYHCKDMQSLYAGLKCRYLIEQNGLFLQAGARYLHGAPNYNDLQVTPEIGYCFFLNRHLTIEPSLFYDISTNKFSEYSKAGVKVGLAWYFDNDKKPSDYVRRKKK
ncbi:MAG: outer membrane beta-barrel protein [Bacteroidaceae bacterium]|nr:outer membrane beta-barrel protein [Bacteroidaceae bacterium]